MLMAKYGHEGFIAVRSSAQAEDREFSFAGQFDSVLNVPFESRAVQEAYKRVVASLFSERAGAYHKQLGIDIRSIKMAVACVVMVDADVSGVIYSVNPGGDDNTMLVNATWGLGASVVEGQTDADLYKVRKGSGPRINKREDRQKGHDDHKPQR